MFPVRITVDPGTEFTGVAIWNAEPSSWEQLEAPVEVHLLRSRLVADAPFEDRALDISHQFNIVVRNCTDIQLAKVVEIASELPGTFGGSAASMAASIRGDIVKLAFMVGCIGRVSHAAGIPFRPVEVREWKGQMSKSLVERRIRDLLGRAQCSDFQRDIWDAVGIGLHLKGCF